MAQKLNELALGYTFAILTGLCMLVMGVLGAFGFYTEAVAMMQAFHIWFSTSAGGIIMGIIEGAVFGFVFGYLTAWVYNKFA